MHDSKTPYFVVKSMLMDLLKVSDMDQPHQEREKHLLNTFTNPFIINNLPMLNDLLHLQVINDNWQPAYANWPTSPPGKPFKYNRYTNS